jgi:hypothetical protein
MRTTRWILAVVVRFIGWVLYELAEWIAWEDDKLRL